MNHWMFRCQDVSQKISQSMDEPLPFIQRMAVRMHLLMCRYCWRFNRQVAMLREISRMEENQSPVEEKKETLSEEVKARMKRKIRYYQRQ